MFTGIVQKIAPLLSATPQGECLRVRIKKPLGWKLTPGQSVAVDGVCSTVVLCKSDFFEVEYMQETLIKTTVKTFKKNQVVNLERSLTLKDFVDGGLVQGHVDMRGKVKKVEKTGEMALLEITLPEALKKYIAPIGSVTVNGVSLTVARVKKDTFSMALIPYTLEHTNLGLLKKGDMVNVEVDILARYIVNARIKER
ncbi:MAG: riboflavin synthase [Candidatus Moranbacteria bacterium]|nr:riboflavin synthase [Candidatus Moranbacteria bacterium]